MDADEDVGGGFNGWDARRGRLKVIDTRVCVNLPTSQLTPRIRL